MISDNIYNFLIGWGVGYSYANARHTEKEVKQGENYYLASLHRFNQISQIASIIQQINIQTAPYRLKTPINLMCNFYPLLIGFPISLLCAAVKQGNYETIAQAYNNQHRNFYFPFSHISLPEKLGNNTTAALNFITDHGDKFLQIAVITGAVALITLGNPISGGTILAALTYQAIDERGLVPRKISLFMETYKPLVATLGVIIGGTLFLRAISLLTLATYINSPLANSIHYKIDKIAIKLFKINRASLEEMESKVVYKESMTYEEINKALNGTVAYEINPAHCSKASIDISEFPTDNHFEGFLELFDKVDWESKYSLIYQKVLDDERFLRLLTNSFTGVNQETLKSQADKYITQLAEAKGITKNKYLANWVREQMECLVANLTGKKRVKGTQQDLDTAINNCSLVLGYLSKLDLNEPNLKLELEDTVLKLAVEGGDYCARGIKRASDELARGIIQNHISLKIEEINPSRDYELKILQALQNKRAQIIGRQFQEIVKVLPIPNQVSQDVHGFDMYREYLSLGFYPLTPQERSNLGWHNIILWESYASNYNMMISTYRNELEEVISVVGFQHFTDYMRNFIGENESLTDEQKEDLRDRLANDFETFYNLLFVRLGVLREQQRRNF